MNFKSFEEIPDAWKKSVKSIVNRERISIYKPPIKETVVNSETIKWKPVDKVAARVIAKAKWYEQPPQQKAKHMSYNVPVKTHTQVGKDGFRETLINSDSLDTTAAGELIKTAPKALSAAEQLVERAEVARDVLRVLMADIGPNWDQFHCLMEKETAVARQLRIGMEYEFKQLMTNFRDVRAFFLSNDHEKEVERLERFVKLCHELKELQESGFLDAVSDIILKFDCRKM